MTLGRMVGLALALAALDSPLLAQQSGSDGEAFLNAVRDSNGGKAIELLSSRGSTVVNYRGYSGDAGLHIAARRRDGQWLGFLLGKGADANLADKNGDTPLIIVSRIGFDEGARILLAHRAKVDLGNRLGETPLISAVQQRRPQTVRLLLEAGANPDKPDNAAGYSARDYAKQDRRSTESLRLIDSIKSTRKAIVGPSVK